MRSGLTFVVLAVVALSLVSVATIRPTETVVRGLGGATLVERSAEIPGDWKSMAIVDSPDADNVAISYEDDVDNWCPGCGGSGWSNRPVTRYDFRVGAARPGHKPPLRLAFTCGTTTGYQYGYCNAPAVRRKPFEGGWLYVVTIANGMSVYAPHLPRDDQPIGAFVRLPPGSTFPEAPAEPWSGWRSLLAVITIVLVGGAVHERVRSRAPARAKPPSTIYRDRPIEEPESPVYRARRRRAWGFVVASVGFALWVFFFVA